MSEGNDTKWSVNVTRLSLLLGIATILGGGAYSVGVQQSRASDVMGRVEKMEERIRVQEQAVSELKVMLVEIRGDVKEVRGAIMEHIRKEK